jgi:hypothetical protein
MTGNPTRHKSSRSAGNLRKRGTTGKYPPTPFAYLRKHLPANNILIGDDPAQCRCLAQQLTPFGARELVPITRVDKVTDSMLLGHEGLLYQVSTEHGIDLSPEVKSRTGIWDASPILKGSAGANAIVRQAAAILNMSDELSRETMDFVGKKITKYEEVEDVRGALWLAVWHLTGDCTPEPRWIEPWEDPVRWLSPKADTVYRLQGLYLTLVAWSFLATGEPLGLKQLNITPEHQAYLRTLKLNRSQVYDSIKQLSIWRAQHTEPIFCALAIAAIWQK